MILVVYLATPKKGCFFHPVPILFIFVPQIGLFREVINSENVKDLREKKKVVHLYPSHKHQYRVKPKMSNQMNRLLIMVA